MSDPVQVEAARIPDRDRLLQALRENGLEARAVDEIGIEVTVDSDDEEAADESPWNDGVDVAAEPSPQNPLRGSCLCGGVRFEVTAPFLWANHCHCSRCRKHSGAFGGTQGRVPRDGFRLLSGEELICVYRPGDGRVKAFCSVCGSSLFGNEWPEGDEIAIRFGALDEDPGTRPQFHTFVESRAPWDELPDDGLPRHDEGNPG